MRYRHYVPSHTTYTYRHRWTPPTPPHFTYIPTYTYQYSSVGAGAGAVFIDGKLGKKMRIFTYILFAYNILLTIAVILYSSLTLDSEMADDCIYYFFILSVYELIYIPISLCIFIKKKLDDAACCYSIFVTFTAMFPFIRAMCDFTDKTFPTGHYIVFVGGTSLLMAMSLIYTMIGMYQGMNNTSD